MKAVRCAIYTRKSSEEGLEQSFNSLDAQAEACAAYVLSQASEGWTRVAERYDDGGLSGGTLERPALQRLLADIADGKVDIVVVYKVDRLTRSLLDFSKLVEAFDRAGVSFVSVTQSFNTTTSMGRLTLNMLLSFAQFEREVTAERIRDKIAASKARGMWMGGTPPLGYKPDGRSLAIVEAHAELVRDIFRRYLALGNVRLVQAALDRDGVRTPARVTTAGKAYGGVPFGRGQLYVILRNIIYTGRIPHKGKTYPGTHPAIVEQATFDAVQALLAANRQGERRAVRAATPSLLAGLVVDGDGNPLIATHASKAAGGATVRYRYYTSRPKDSGDNHPAARIPAPEIEGAVARRVADLLADPIGLVAQAWGEVSGGGISGLAARCESLAAAAAKRDRELIRALVTRVIVHDSRIEVQVATAALAERLGLSLAAGAPAILELTADVRLTRSGRAMRLVRDDGAAASAAPDLALARLLARAHGWWKELRQGDLDITMLAAREQLSPSWVTRVVRLTFLSPQVTKAALRGELRTGVDGKALIATDAVPASWAEQAARMLPAASTSARFF